MGILVNFHEVNNAVWFEQTLCFLKAKYNPVPLKELMDIYKCGSDLKTICHITVDDGDKSFYRVIYPVLKKHGIPATTFVSSDAAIMQVNFWFQEIIGYDKHTLLDIISDLTKIDTNDLKRYSIFDILKCLLIDQIWDIINRYQKINTPEKKPCQNMSVGELRELENSGLVTIGAHTLRHPILANEEMSLSKNEITNSISNLADILGHDIKYFAYPNGIPILDFGQREMNILRDSGCTCAFSNESGNFTLESDLFRISRYGISSGETKNYIRSKTFFGSSWNMITEFKPGNESVNRRSILNLLKK